MPEPLGSCGNMLGEDYSSKLVWGELKHPSWGDALVWKSNRPLSQNAKEAKVKLRTDLSCCWQLFTFFLCHTRPPYTKKRKLHEVKPWKTVAAAWQINVLLILRILCLLEMCGFLFFTLEVFNQCFVRQKNKKIWLKFNANLVAFWVVKNNVSLPDVPWLKLYS